MGRELEYLDPDVLVIVGRDEDEEGHPLNDERASWEVDEHLVRNIMVYGIQQPVIYRLEQGRRYVVDGRQRVLAARVAKQRQAAAGEYETKVPCRAVRADDNRVSGIMVATNELRKDDSVLAKARKASRLLDMMGDKNEVAVTFGRSVKTVNNWLQLLTAAPEVHQAIEAGRISAQVGLELSKKPRSEQLQALEQILEPSPATQNGKGGTSSSSGSDSTDRSHPGIKKGWLRKAVKSDAYEKLEENQRCVLNWFLSGYAPKEHWLDQFTWDVDEEMGSHP